MIGIDTKVTKNSPCLKNLRESKSKRLRTIARENQKGARSSDQEQQQEREQARARARETEQAIASA